MDERLRAEHLPDRRGQRRPAGLGADALELVEHGVEPVAEALAPQAVVELGDEPGRQVVLGRAHGDSRRNGRNRILAERLVDELGGLPEEVERDAGVDVDLRQVLRDRLRRGPVERDRERIERARDAVRPGPRGLDRRGERGAAGALRVQADRQAARLADALDQLADAARGERAGRIVDEHARRAELAQVIRRARAGRRRRPRGRGCARARSRAPCPTPGSPRPPPSGSRGRSADRGGGRRRCRCRPRSR